VEGAWLRLLRVEGGGGREPAAAAVGRAVVSPVTGKGGRRGTCVCG